MMIANIKERVDEEFKEKNKEELEKHDKMLSELKEELDMATEKILLLQNEKEGWEVDRSELNRLKLAVRQKIEAINEGAKQIKFQMKKTKEANDKNLQMEKDMKEVNSINEYLKNKIEELNSKMVSNSF